MAPHDAKKRKLRRKRQGARKKRRVTNPRIFDRELSTNDGHLYSLYHETKILEHTIALAEDEGSDSKIEARIDNVRKALDEVYSRETTRRESCTSSLEIDLLKRSITQKALSKGFQRPMSDQSLASTSEQDLENLKSHWSSSLYEFVLDMDLDGLCGSALVKSQHKAPGNGQIGPDNYLQAFAAKQPRNSKQKNLLSKREDPQLRLAIQAKLDSGELDLDRDIDTICDWLNKRPADQLLLGTRDNQEILMRRFLFKWRALSHYIRGNPDALGSETMEALATELRPWQKVAAPLLRTMLRGPGRGAILGDGMGLGKTLTAITVTLRKGNGYQGPVVIVAPPGLHSTWKDEIRFHLQDTHQVKILVLKNPQITMDNILSRRIDIVIVGTQFLMRRYKELQAATKIGYLFSEDQDLKVRGVKKSQWRPYRVNHPLDGHAMSLFGLTIPLLIVDEVHGLRNIKSISHKAVLSLKYDAFLGLSGTPIPNRWHDIYGILEFMPGNPFDSFESFVACFGTIINGAPSRECDAESLAIVLDAFLVARPQSVLDLPGLIEHDVIANLSRTTCLEVAELANEFYRLARMKKKDPGPVTPAGHAAALAKATKAELISVCDLFYQEPLKDLNTEAFEGWCREKGFDIDRLDATQLIEWVKKGSGRKSKIKNRQTPIEALGQGGAAGNNESGSGETSGEEEDWEDDEKNDYVPDESEDSDSDPDDPEWLPHDSGKTDYDSDEMEDLESESLPSEQGDVTTDKDHDLDVNDDDDDAEDEDHESSFKKRNEWLKKLNDADPEEYVNKPRVKAIVDQIFTIHSDKPGLKVLVFSRFTKVLDVVEKSLQHRYEKGNGTLLPDVLRFDGTKSQKYRDEVRLQVQNDDKAATVLITLGAGGVGLTLTAAHNVILCESSWVRAEELQALSRCYRQGQVEAVHVYRITSPNSAIEQYIRSCSDFKFQTVSKIMDLLSRVEQEEALKLDLDFVDVPDFVQDKKGSGPFLEFTHQSHGYMLNSTDLS
ncbi:uncharacterized protein CLUP02_11020 [Colletotrichum lupini]|uniref:Uncharacterized protein n=1 Tax=Colletotrichum lupini TaxID=145971 RepID=A0A9Q8WJX0_9PEZI|nr:uncharacterized protein CLUP02_11020 [Colletotrichum lupini]UQC85522.1 hypothetical protein CLUP02_11020 [Colletotrichum lupini]